MSHETVSPPPANPNSRPGGFNTNDPREAYGDDSAWQGPPILDDRYYRQPAAPNTPSNPSPYTVNPDSMPGWQPLNQSHWRDQTARPSPGAQFAEQGAGVVRDTGGNISRFFGNTWANIGMGGAVLGVAGAVLHGTNTVDLWPFDNDKVKAAPVVPGEIVSADQIDIETFDPAKLAKLSLERPGIEIDVADPFFERVMDKAFVDYIRAIQDVNGYHMIGPIGSDGVPVVLDPKKIDPATVNIVDYIGTGDLDTDSPQQVVNRKSIKEFIGLNTELFTKDGQPNKVLAQNLLLANHKYLAPEDEGSMSDASAYEEGLRKINRVYDTQNPNSEAIRQLKVPSTLAVAPGYKVFTQGGLGDYRADGATSMAAIVGGGPNTSLSFNFVWQEVHGFDDTSASEPVLTLSIAQNEIGYQTNLDQWDPLQRPPVRGYPN